MAARGELILVTRVYLTILGCLALLQGSVPTTAAETNRPNFIILLADDLGWADVGYHGNEFSETPNLDRLAQAGIQFTQAYANAANCAPTRASILTGRYPAGHGILTVGLSHRGERRAQRLIPIENQEFLQPDGASLANGLAHAGYHCAFIGKWHLGDHLINSPTHHGFHFALAGWTRGSPRSYFSPYQNPALSDGPDGEHLTDRLVTEAIQYLDSRQQAPDPFFLYLSFYSVHTPIQGDPALIEKYQAKPDPTGLHNPVYAAMIEKLDANVGRLVDYLGATGMLENTIILFFSDNPFAFGSSAATLTQRSGQRRRLRPIGGSGEGYDWSA